MHCDGALRNFTRTSCVSMSGLRFKSIVLRLRFGGLRKRLGPLAIDVEEYADFLIDLPGGPDPVADLSVLFEGTSREFSEVAFHFRNFKVADIIVEVLRLRGSCSTGWDEIIMSQIFDGLEVLAPILTDLFNDVLATNRYPDAWKRSIIRPIPKRANPTLPAHCRPVTLQPNISKIFEVVLLKHIADFLEESNYFHSRQFGFRKGLNSELAVLDLVGRIRKNIDSGRVVLVAFEDNTVAFNCLFCSSIILSLLEVGFSLAAARLIASSLSGRGF